MQALHRLAGVQGTSDSNTQPPAPVSTHYPIPPPPPIPDEGADDADTRSIRSTQRTASLPLNRQPSHRSFRSTRSAHSRKSASSAKRQGSRDELAVTTNPPPTPNRPTHYNAQQLSPEAAARPAPDTRPQAQPQAQPESSAALRPSAETGVSHASIDDEEFSWGPSHPCFPHPNPHCSPKSVEFEATRVIRVKRDWLAAGDLYPQYANLYPEILEPLVSDSEFRLVIANINSMLKRTHSPYTSRAWIDSLLGAFTGYVWEDLGWTGAKKGEEELEQFIDNWNAEREKEGRDVRIVQPKRTGFISLDFVVPDPGIDVAKSDEGEDGEDEDMQTALSGGPAA
ncbi:Hypothetical predicted protein [Lecanosticta acicola]|uniref:Ras modification protein ERF4 n=1 Tax=Lecanosticta acicola TaxID=111012 RepID=A0AAI8YW52_9PEZI|nr:Hypothetical predicted protein [Lecanosticta acicola]